ncbi:MAG: hypothetical protein WB444_13875 [Gallionella sp.]
MVPLKSGHCTDWINAEGGIPVGLAMGFPGCYPATSLSDQEARRKAILRAQANISRTKQLWVSGEEHVRTDPDGNSRYDMTLTESTGAFLRPVTVVDEAVTNIENVPHLCVLVVENN